MRELCFIAQAVGNCAAIALILTIDLMFCGLCLYIVAMYQELQRMLGCSDQKSKVMPNGNTDAFDHRKSMCDCIQYHLAIIR